MNSEAASSSSPLRIAVPPKRARAEQGVQTNQTMQDLDGMQDELERTRKELDEVTKTMLITEDDRDMWKKLFEDCNKKQAEEIERLRWDYKEQSERVALTTAVEKVIAARSVPRGQSPMELLRPREMKFNCAVLTVCTVPMNTRTLTATGRRHNEGVIRWNNILRNLASQYAGRVILMDIEHELRAMDQARLTTDGIHLDSIEGQA